MAQYPPPPQSPYQQPQNPYGSPQAPYGGSPAPYGPPPPNSGAATFSLIAGLLSLFLCPGLASIAAIIAGHRAKAQIRNSYGRLGGSGMATAGLIMGYITLAFSLIGGCVLVLNFAAISAMLLDSGLY